jgi:glycine/D-amino acid oxidase-like deaminating enzyme
LPWKNVYVAGGHDTKGMTQGPFTGKLVAGMLAGESMGDLEKELAPSRFGKIPF